MYSIRWLVANAETYNINTDYISLGGGFAGAVTAITIDVSNTKDYTNEISSIEATSLAITNLGQSYTSATILDFWENSVGIDLLETINSYYNRSDTKDAPVFIAHGDNDMIVPFSDTEALINNYITTGVNYVFYPLDGDGTVLGILL